MRGRRKAGQAGESTTNIAVCIYKRSVLWFKHCLVFFPFVPAVPPKKEKKERKKKRLSWYLDKQVRYRRL